MRKREGDTNVITEEEGGRERQENDKNERWKEKGRQRGRWNTRKINKANLYLNF